jgi:glycerol kinase
MREIAESAAAIDGIDVPEILPVDGGLAANDLFLQIQADLLGRPVARHVELEATALGACIAAALGVGIATQNDLAPLTQNGKRFESTIDSAQADSRFAEWRTATNLAGHS